MRYLNIWTARGMLGHRRRGHSSRPYGLPSEALEGRQVPLDPSFELVGTLDLAARNGPTFVSEETLHTEMRRLTEEVLAEV
jgi:hypothetical protein